MRGLACACVAFAFGASAAVPEQPYGSANIVSGDGFVLVASYDRSNWSGDLVRFDFGITAPAWSAAKRLPAPAERHIYTSVASGESTELVEFVSGAVPGIERDLIDYLRGERSREGKGMRVRAGALGAIVRSVPVIVGAPSSSVQGEGYEAFRALHARRKGLAYVGANDGMLHAFDIATGIERFAYIPRALHELLPQLARTDGQPKSYLEGHAGVGEAYSGSVWRTVLASGFGMGRSGLFALDITNPDRFESGAGELWQFTGDDDSHMGHVLSAPSIAKFRIGSRDGEPRYRYFVIVPSGGALFLLALDKRERERWRKGTNYYRFAAGDVQNGVLGPATVIPGADGSVQYAYAGDVHGQLWRFDFTAAAPWKNAVSLLFTATDDEGRTQPVSTAPRVVFAPAGGHLVLFGTSGTEGIQSLYAIHDSLDRKRTSASTRKALARRRLSATDNGYRITGAEVEYGRGSGWYLDFAGSERIISMPMADGGVLVASTSVPARDPYAAPTIRTYVLSAVTGFAHAGASPTGIARSGSVFGPPLLVLSGTTRSAPDATGRAMAVRRYSFIPLPPGGEAPPAVDIAIPGRRLSWREILNWDDLHRSATEGEHP